ncbi:MAG: hypothetical protein H7Z13_19735 [Ferruginibacter sp.]|nr:hypothetical protein [Ferruginibacter sp.]
MSIVSDITGIIKLLVDSFNTLAGVKKQKKLFSAIILVNLHESITLLKQDIGKLKHCIEKDQTDMHSAVKNFSKSLNNLLRHFYELNISAFDIYIHLELV